MKHRKKIILGTVLFVVAGLFFAGRALVNPILERTLNTYLKEKLEVKWATPAYRFSYDTLDMDIFSEKITLTQFSMSPLDEFREAFHTDTIGDNTLKELKVNEITIRGIGLLNFLWDRDIEIDEIAIDAVTLDLTVSRRREKKADPDQASIGSAIEGIRLPGIEELALGRFKLGSFDLHQIRRGSGDTLLVFHSEGGSLEGIALTKGEDGENAFFEPFLDEMLLQLNSETLDLKKDLYKVAFEELKYSYASRDLEISALSLEPREDKEAFRKKARFSYEIYDASIKDLLLEDFDLEGYLNQGVVSVGRLALDSLELGIFRDKTKPFDTSRKVPLLNQSMGAMELPLHIGTVEIRNSYMIYTEQSESANPLVIDFSDLELDLDYLTSIPDSLEAGKPLKLALRTRLDRTIPMGIKLEMPYNGNTFHISGYTESAANFASLNKTVLPATGLRFTSGRLDGLYFEMTGTPWKISGTLTLLYHDLRVEIDNPEQKMRKTLSWAANSILKPGNPKPNGRTVVGMVEFERIPYKGLGNFAWKGIQSGLVNSVNPFGNNKVVKPEK